MGHVLTAEGLQPDPEKVKAIKEMPTPPDKQSIQRLLGMTNYQQKFAPRLSEITTPLRELTKIKTSSFGMTKFMVQPWKRQRQFFLQLQSLNTSIQVPRPHYSVIPPCTASERV